MLVNDILDSRYQIWTSTETGKKSFTGCYAGDLLSVVLKSAKAGNLLVTIIANINTVAVAVLADLPAILFCEGQQPSAEMIRKAEEEKIALLSTEMTSVDVILDLARRNLL
jgi:predicted transcriptional regulator